MAEISFAAVSLTFQIFAGCVKGYQLLSEAKGLGSEYRYLRLRIHTEKFRLLDWAGVAGLSPRDSTLRIGRANKGLLLSILEQQHDLLSRFGRYDDKLSPLAKPFISEEWLRSSETETMSSIEEGQPEQQTLRAPQVEELLNTAISFCRKAKSFPLRLKWATIDKANIETLIVRLSGLNDFLRDTLNTEQAQLYFEFQERTCYQIMHLNSTIRQLVDILTAETDTKLTRVSEPNPAAPDLWEAGSSTSSTNLSNEGPSAESLLPPNTGLGALARVKATNIAIESGILTRSLASQLGVAQAAIDPSSGAIRPENIEYLNGGPPDDLSTMELPRTEALMRSPELPETTTKVWIEWTVVCQQLSSASTSKLRPGPRRRTGGEDSEAPASVTNRRLSSLLTLFKNKNGLSSFQVARCIGFFFRDTPSTNRGEDGLCGLVFESPDGYNDTLPPVSLHELLCRNSDGLHLPSLGQRLEIAKALACFLERWHAVNWVHKGLRSFNVLFFSPSTDKKNPTTDVVSGSQDGNSGEIPLIDMLDLSHPFLTGFYFSRPHSKSEWTQKGSVNPAHDIYHHPQVQLDSGRQDAWDSLETFKRVHDIYSLGIVLLEIVHWKPIDAIMDIDLDGARLRDTMRTRRVLLEEDKYLAHVKAHAGDILHDVIRACLTGAEAFGLEERYEDARPEDAVRLQAGFYTHVVQKLGQIRV
ncbi:prion-inhibition and propagation-domain-containing protein [Podospora didyma]|uniref:Prion-inhibition and propagation-domain-containing protein n=1 Tax=Podospora didyma TaxID=330526 RepID=A0AAE0U4E9_9PEZI|nr:prion-inhibition and propagation-domain-containing protein [Podospora didyma]